jgi:hypothetical protein
MLVDPSTNMIDFDREKFDISNELWLKMRNGEIDPNKYGLPGRYAGLISILGKVCTDLASILGTEYPIFQYAPILEYTFNNENNLTKEHLETLNEISELMNSINSENLSKLRDIYNNTSYIQISKAFGTNRNDKNKN